MFEELQIKTTEQTVFQDITAQISDIVRQYQINEGIVVINIPHTTAAVTINENADPDVKNDIIEELNKIVPFKDNYQHIEGNSAAHIKSSIIGCNEMLIIKGSRLLLGRWQGIYFCEFDGPRLRKVQIQLIEK